MDPALLVSRAETKLYDFAAIDEEELQDIVIPLDLQISARLFASGRNSSASGAPGDDCQATPSDCSLPTDVITPCKCISPLTTVALLQAAAAQCMGLRAGLMCCSLAPPCSAG